METYREKLKLQNVVFAIGCVALALFSEITGVENLHY